MVPRFPLVGLVLAGFLAVSEFALTDAPPQFVTLARDGKPAVVIVTAEDPILAERTAARELVEYRNKATGGEFATATEQGYDPKQPAVYVGPTAFAKRHGLDAANWGPERWTVRTAGKSLIPVGGRPRGTLICLRAGMPTRGLRAAVWACPIS